ncbi:hypothetical protein QUF74_04115 [Candidatus Halobeggiatoa sp. HSG11]|nr:hypothetical protein [Candidatus Halobeggiatoa sp. HSG11]
MIKINPSMHIGEITDIAVDPLERYMVTSSKDKTVRVWTLPELKLRRVLRLDKNVEGPIHAVAISPNGKDIVVGGRTGCDVEGKNCAIYLFDYMTGKLKKTVHGIPGDIRTLSFSPDTYGRYLLVTHEVSEAQKEDKERKNSLIIYRTLDYSNIQAFDNEKDKLKEDKCKTYINHAEFNTHGHLITTCSDNYVRLYDSNFNLWKKDDITKKKYDDYLDNNKDYMIKRYIGINSSLLPGEWKDWKKEFFNNDKQNKYSWMPRTARFSKSGKKLAINFIQGLIIINIPKKDKPAQQNENLLFNDVDLVIQEDPNYNAWLVGDIVWSENENVIYAARDYSPTLLRYSLKKHSKNLFKFDTDTEYSGSLYEDINILMNGSVIIKSRNNFSLVDGNLFEQFKKLDNQVNISDKVSDNVEINEVSKESPRKVLAITIGKDQDKEGQKIPADLINSNIIPQIGINYLEISDDDNSIKYNAFGNDYCLSLKNQRKLTKGNCVSIIEQTNGSILKNVKHSFDDFYIDSNEDYMLLGGANKGKNVFMIFDDKGEKKLDELSDDKITDVSLNGGNGLFTSGFAGFFTEKQTRKQEEQTENQAEEQIEKILYGYSLDEGKKILEYNFKTKKIKLFFLENGEPISLNNSEETSIKALEVVNNKLIIIKLDDNKIQSYRLTDGKSLLLDDNADNSKVYTEYHITPSQETLVFDSLPKQQVILKGHGAKLSSDGKQIITISEDTVSEKDIVILWDSITGKRLGGPISHTNVNSATFNHTGDRIITISDNNTTAKVWSLKTSDSTWKEETFTGKTNFDNKNIIKAKFSPKGKYIIVRYRTPKDKKITISLFNSEDGKYIKDIHSEIESKNEIYTYFTPDGKYVVLEYTEKEHKKISLWNSNDGKEKLSDIDKIKFSPDGKKFITVSYGKENKGADVKLCSEFNCTKLNIKSKIENIKSRIDDIKFSSNRIFTTSGKAIYLWDNEIITSTDDEKNIKNPKARIFDYSDAEFSPDGKRIVAKKNKIFYLFDSIDGRQLINSLSNGEGNNDYVRYFFSKNSEYIITITISGNDNDGYLWDAKDGSLIKKLNHTSYYEGVTFSSDDNFITQSNNGHYYLHTNNKEDKDSDGKKLLNIVSGSIYFSSDDKYIMHQSPGYRTTLFNREGRQIHIFPNTDSAEFVSGNNILLQENDGIVKLIKINNIYDNNADIHDIVETKINRTLVISPDGKYILTILRNNIAQLWDTISGKQITKLIGHKDIILSADFSYDGKYIVTASKDNTARIWNTTGKEIRKLIHKEAVLNAHFENNGQRIVTVSKNKIVYLWDQDYDDDDKLEIKEEKVPINKLVTHTDTVFDATFSHDNQYIITASKDNTAILWNIGDDEKNIILSGHNSVVLNASFSYNDEYIITASEDTNAILWNKKGEQIEKLPHDAPVLDASFSNNGKYIVTVSKGEANIWSITITENEKIEVKKIKPLEHKNGNVLDVKFSHDNKHIITVLDNNQTELWGINGDHKRTLSFPDKQTVHNAVFNPSDDEQIVIASFSAITNVADLMKIKISENKEARHWDWDVDFNSDESLLALAAGEDGVLLWDMKNKQHYDTIEHPNDGIVAVAFSHDNKLIASGGFSGKVYLWEIGNNEPLMKSDEHSNVIVSLAFTSDGQFLASADVNNKIFLWDIKNRNILYKKPLEGEFTKGGIYRLSFSSDNNILVVGRGKEILLWDIENKQKFREPLVGHSGIVKSVTFSPNGETLASADENGEILLWNWNNIIKGQDDNAKKTPQYKKLPTGDYDSRGLAIAFSPDNETLVSSSNSGEILFWDVNKRTLRHNTKTDNNRSATGLVVFSPAKDSSRETVAFTIGSRGDFAKLIEYDSSFDNVSLSTTTDNNFQDNDYNKYFQNKDEGILNLNKETFLTISSDGEMLITQSKSNENLGRIWKTSDGELVKSLDKIKYAAFSNNGRNIIYIDDNSVKTFKISDNNEEDNLLLCVTGNDDKPDKDSSSDMIGSSTGMTKNEDEQSKCPDYAAISNDNKVIIGYHNGDNFKFSVIIKREKEGTIKKPIFDGKIDNAGSTEILYAQFSKDSKFLIMNSKDTIFIFDIENVNEEQKLKLVDTRRLENNTISSVSFGDDNRFINVFFKENAQGEKFLQQQTFFYNFSMFNKDGKLNWRKPIPSTLFSEFETDYIGSNNENDHISIIKTNGYYNFYNLNDGTKLFDNAEDDKENVTHYAIVPSDKNDVQGKDLILYTDKHEDCKVAYSDEKDAKDETCTNAKNLTLNKVGKDTYKLTIPTNIKNKGFDVADIQPAGNNTIVITSQDDIERYLTYDNSNTDKPVELNVFKEMEPGYSVSAITPNNELLLSTSSDKDGVFLHLYEKSEEKWKKKIPFKANNIKVNSDVVVLNLQNGTLNWRSINDGEELFTLFPYVDEVQNLDWILWTPRGYYDSSVAGENLIGWQINHDANTAPEFFVASQFRKYYYRPDVISQIWEKKQQDEVVLFSANQSSKYVPEVEPEIRKLLTTYYPHDVVDNILTAFNVENALKLLNKEKGYSIPSKLQTQYDIQESLPPVVTLLNIDDECAVEDYDVESESLTKDKYGEFNDLTKCYTPKHVKKDSGLFQENKREKIIDHDFCFSKTDIDLYYSIRHLSDEPITTLKVLADGRLLGKVYNKKNRDTSSKLTQKRLCDLRPEIKTEDKVKKYLSVNCDLSQNDYTLRVSLPPRDVNISLIAENRFAASEPVTIRLHWNGDNNNLYLLAVGTEQGKASKKIITTAETEQKVYEKITTAEKDAICFAETMKLQEGKLFDKVNIKLLQRVDGHPEITWLVGKNNQAMASKKTILNGLKWLEKNTKVNDVAILFLAGSGTQGKDGQYYFLPRNLDKDNITDTAISYRDITKTMASLSGNSLIFADVCYKNIFDYKSTIHNPIITNEMAQSKNGVTIFAANNKKCGNISDNTENGIFTTNLLDGLFDSEKTVVDGKITLQKLKSHLYKREQSFAIIPKTINENFTISSVEPVEQQEKETCICKTDLEKGRCFITEPSIEQLDEKVIDNIAICYDNNSEDWKSNLKEWNLKEIQKEDGLSFVYIKKPESQK